MASPVRMSFSYISRTTNNCCFSTVLAGGTFPGPLIRGFKVFLIVLLYKSIIIPPQLEGDRFQINVKDELVDDSMERSTTIVRS
jgi:hypothetical protein